MTAEILSIGTEILLGDITNTNAQYLARQLANLGIGVYFQTVVGDNADRLLQTYERAFERADLVITTGGLGPTDDDLTKEIGAQYFGLALKEDAASMQALLERFRNYSAEAMPESNKKQAFMPEGSTVIKNENGTAPGCMIEQNGKILIMMPGPPNEALPMFENHVLPFLQSRQEATFVSRTLRVSGMGESMAAEKIKHLIDAQQNPTIAPYAKTNEVELRITAKAGNEDEANGMIAPVAEQIYGILGEYIYGEGNMTLEGAVVQMLIENNLTIAVAESCTGGLFTSRLVNVTGVSQVLTEGIVTYSNESKINRLGVKPETLEQFGAVSHEVAIEMAEGIARTSGASIGISTTGVAGPDGGTDEKPVGLVYVGLHMAGETKYKKLSLIGDRDRIRTRTVATLLEWLRTELKHTV